MRSSAVSSFVVIAFFFVILPAIGDAEIPTLIKEWLEEKGMTLEDLKERPELRREWLKQLQQIRGVPAQHGGAENLEGAIHTDKLTKVSDFYKVIVENNLFRPLGYKRRKFSRPPFELIATIIYVKAGKNKALIRSNRTRKVYYLIEGQEFEGAKIERIADQQVTMMYNGKLQTFHVAKVPFSGISKRW